MKKEESGLMDITISEALRPGQWDGGGNRTRHVVEASEADNTSVTVLGHWR